MNTGIQIPDDLLSRRVPKLGMTTDELYFAFGSHKLVRDLISEGHLCGKKAGATTLFDAAHVTQVWGNWNDGKFDR